MKRLINCFLIGMFLISSVAFPTILSEQKKQYEQIPFIIEEIIPETFDLTFQEEKQQPILPEEETVDPFEKKFVTEVLSISKNKTTENDAQLIYRSIKKYSELYEIKFSVIAGMIAQESNFIKTANSRAGASKGRGLMQVSDTGLNDFNKKTNHNYLTSDMYCIEKNIEVGCWIYTKNKDYLAPYSPLSDDDLIIAYNCGNSTFKKERTHLLKGRRKSGKKYNHLIKVKNYMTKFEY